jgi:predicted RNA binding protein YcfA (HicA-like mRNA interferase family)
MAPIKTKDIESALTSKGFKKVDTHHEMYWLYYDGKKTQVRTRISHSEKEYDNGLIALMAKQAKLSKAEFLDLINCPLSKEEYLKLLIKNGHVRISISN